MKRVVLFFYFFLLLTANIIAQDNSSLQSGVSKLQPPIINLVEGSIRYVDANNNKILEANETGHVIFTIKNDGKGAGVDCKVLIRLAGTTSDVYVEDKDLPTILPGAVMDVDIPIVTGVNAKNGVLILQFSIDEPNGFGTDPVDVEIVTKGHEYPKVKIVDYTIVSADSIISKKMPINMQLMMQNMGENTASNTKVKISLPYNVFLTDGDETTLINKLKRDEQHMLMYTIIANNNYKENEIPITFTVSDDQSNEDEVKVITVTLGSAVQSFFKEEIVVKKMEEKPTTTVQDADNKMMFAVNGVTFNMIKVQAGTFKMGATPEQINPWNDEKPVHTVTLTKDYSIGETEVTQALWEAVMGTNPSDNKGENLPVENVSWNDCQMFISKLNAITGQYFRLPTEAEWEFAARGGNMSKGYKYSGSNNIYEIGWFSSNSERRASPVATKQPNELGLYDMSGNVWEWCQDKRGKYTEQDVTDPKGAENGSQHVNRGGSYYNAMGVCRVSCRNFNNANMAKYLGLRLAL
ncbi:MAG: SUMF1/EgtB/PvdO family nonheme iron enzyme [Muribaculaceae bacterium]|nr:SUMF1/EgtB/PvdO family nonheme iron enzyme [Muribaculaceae bacterium]